VAALDATPAPGVRGHARQHLNLLGYALMVNGIALHRHRRHRTHQLAA
jgi:hypothetical protein